MVARSQRFVWRLKGPCITLTLLLYAVSYIHYEPFGVVGAIVSWNYRGRSYTGKML